VGLKIEGASDWSADSSRLPTQGLIGIESRLRNSSSDVGTLDVESPEGVNAFSAPPFASFCGLKSRSFSALVFRSWDLFGSGFTAVKGNLLRTSAGKAGQRTQQNSPIKILVNSLRQGSSSGPRLGYDRKNAVAHALRPCSKRYESCIVCFLRRRGPQSRSDNLPFCR
jgi:hypothetical protein